MTVYLDPRTFMFTTVQVKTGGERIFSFHPLGNVVDQEFFLRYGWFISCSFASSSCLNSMASGFSAT
jgi:hypothetical protein